MLTSTKPRSPTPRETRTTHPVTVLRPSSQATLIAAPISPTPQSRRPSISNTMHWLSRSSTQSSTPYSPSKPTRISEPKLVRSIELLSQQRSGVLGSGATVVRTPDEALRETGVRLTFDGKAKDKQIRPQTPDIVHLRSSIASEKIACDELTPSETTLVMASPPLPPLPLPEEEESHFFSEMQPEVPKLPPRPTRAPPPAPSAILRSSLKLSKSMQYAEDDTNTPPLPPHISTFPEPLPFRPILVSEVPTGAVDTSKIVVTLETSTSSHKTTLETLQSRHSHLSRYLSLLLPSERTSTASSVYSTESDDVSIFRNHLTSQGLLPRVCSSVHIFLDRPSAPYTHVLNYLRMPVAMPDTPESLPRSVQMYSSTHLRLEALLELRDEAAYLNLEGLHKLCLDEIRLRHGPRLHTRGQSTGTVASAHSLRASIYSLHALLERVENDARSNPRDSSSSESKSSKGSAVDMMTSRTPPTPQSWTGHLRGRSDDSNLPVRSPPAGWI